MFHSQVTGAKWKEQRKKEDTQLKTGMIDRTRRTVKMITKGSGVDCVFHSLNLHWFYDLLG